MQKLLSSDLSQHLKSFLGLIVTGISVAGHFTVQPQALTRLVFVFSYAKMHRVDQPKWPTGS